MRTFFLKLCLLITLIFGCTFVACKENETSSNENVEFYITNKITSLEQGDVYTFETVADGVVVWESSNDQIVSVENGKIVAKKYGTSTITATFGDKYDSVTINVTDDYRPTLSANELNTIELYQGATYMVSPSVVYKQKEVEEDLTYNYSSSNSSIVSVADDGTLTAVALGKVTITITTEYRFYALTTICEVEVVTETYVTLTSPANITLATMEIGDYTNTAELTYRTVIDGEETTGESVQWNSDNSAVVSVQNGRLTAVKPGEAKVKVSWQYGEKTYYAYCTVTVIKPVIKTGLTLNYLIGDEVILPNYEIADFNSENIQAIYEKDIDIYNLADGTIHKDLSIGSRQVKKWTVETGVAKYELSAYVTNAIITSVVDLNGLTEKLAKLTVKDNTDIDGYYFDGYVVFDGNVDYNGATFAGIANALDCGENNPKKNGFKGIIDGNGYTISNMVFDVASSAFVWSLLDGSIVENLNFKNCVCLKAATAVVVVNFNAATISNVKVQGKVLPQGTTITSLNNARGLVVANVVKSGGVIEGVTAELLEPLTSKNMTAVFGFVGANATGLFSDCVVINANALYGTGEGLSEDGFNIVETNANITVYSTYKDYYLGNGWSFVENESVICSCIAPGTEVYKKAGEADVVIKTIPTGHSFATDADGQYCENCEREVTLFGTADADCIEGLEVSSLFNNASVAIVEYEGATIGLTNGKITYEEIDVSMSARTYMITLVDGSIYQVDVVVWDLLIDSEEDLRAFGSNYDNDAGSVTRYFKMTADVTLTNYDGMIYSWKNADGLNVNPYFENNVLFDGGGHTIKNFIQEYEIGLFNITTEGTIIRNLTVESGGCANLYSGPAGVFAEYCLGGTFENITVKFIAPNKISLFGQIGSKYYGNVTKVNLKNVDIIADIHSDDHLAIGTVATAEAMEKVNVVFENVNIVNIDALLKNYNDNIVTTKTELEGLITCTNVMLYANKSDYEQ